MTLALALSLALSFSLFFLLLKRGAQLRKLREESQTFKDREARWNKMIGDYREKAVVLEQKLAALECEQPIAVIKGTVGQLIAGECWSVLDGLFYRLRPEEMSLGAISAYVAATQGHEDKLPARSGFLERAKPRFLSFREKPQTSAKARRNGGTGSSSPSPLSSTGDSSCAVTVPGYLSSFGGESSTSDSSNHSSASDSTSYSSSDFSGGGGDFGGGGASGSF